MGELLVRGRAEGRLAPSHAVLDVTVQAREPASQEAAVARAATACELVDDLIQRQRQGTDPLIRTAETSSIRTAEHWEYGSGAHQRRRVGWIAERRSRLECAPDAEGLTALVAALIHNDIRLSGPQWHVAPDVAGWDDLRTAAVADARRRADAYAAGAGVRVGAVRWIAEPGVRREPSGDAFAGPALRAAGLAVDHGDQPEPLPVRVAVEPVAVDITVEVAFDLADSA
ncbi:MAG TPA: SIMPL domain-containing protein [Euzebyales bacterium]|nr:SIMPL domain-containing protein [Euzebyales bacterium]